MLIKIRCCDPICASRTSAERWRAAHWVPKPGRTRTQHRKHRYSLIFGSKSTVEPRMFVDINEALVDPESPVKKGRFWVVDRPREQATCLFRSGDYTMDGVIIAASALIFSSFREVRKAEEPKAFYVDAGVKQCIQMQSLHMGEGEPLPAPPGLRHSPRLFWLFWLFSGEHLPRPRQTNQNGSRRRSIRRGWLSDPELPRPLAGQSGKATVGAGRRPALRVQRKKHGSGDRGGGGWSRERDKRFLFPPLRAGSVRVTDEILEFFSRQAMMPADWAGLVKTCVPLGQVLKTESF